ncbi:hypothetical protein BN2476_170106 [Paraburkholderia piptadeniae]|uniref:Uncharacterized protein n=1 Tax=Paraburkholderia piptadeniae TaxID=1701573 RepID=A0A1N7RUJ4_9BURK|nr:hypothetical protein [Paraburkholderia piptadeniae]SIT38383.1 hypothetical protein BN2476_170106 [Paraburkholderia piptadeniae]
MALELHSINLTKIPQRIATEGCVGAPSLMHVIIEVKCVNPRNAPMSADSHALFL